MKQRSVFRMRSLGVVAAATIAFAVVATTAQAQTTVRIAKQFGISYLPLTIMEHKQVLEEHGRRLGLDLKSEWVQFVSGAPMNEAILSGNLDFASGGVGPLLTIWGKTRGNIGVKGVAALNSMPLYLNTINPKVKSIADFTSSDRIALPAVKISIQAITLQMAAEKAFGDGQANKLDALTVTMSHPDAQTALLSGQSEITAHFGSPPFQYQQLDKPGIRTVLNSYDVLGGPATFNTVWTTSKFRSENPRLYDAFVKALDEAIAQINADKRAASVAYLRISKDKDSVDNILKMLNDPNIVYTMTPQGIMKYVDFMQKTGAVKVKPDSWKDLFFPNAHALQGS